MADYEAELVDVIVRQAKLRRRRERLHREFRDLRDQGKENVHVGEALLENKKLLLELHKKRKDLASKLLASRFEKD